MVSYGAWQQNPDYEQFSTKTYPTHIDLDLSGVETETPFQNPQYTVTEDDLHASVTTAAAGANTPVLYLNLYGVIYTWGYTLSVPNVQTGWAAEVATRTLTIAAQTYVYSPGNYGYTDPDAIGIDYENQPYNPDNPFAPAPGVQQTLQMTTETVIAGDWTDDSLGGAAVAPNAPNTDMYVRATGAADEALLRTFPPSAEVSTNNPIQQNLATPIDLTPHLAGIWSGTVRMRVVAIDDPWRPPLSHPDYSSNGIVEYGWGLESVRLLATVRPPLWRFVYAAEPPPTYRRSFPRDDGLAGGAPRNYPPSRAVQSSNRTSGGYL